MLFWKVACATACLACFLGFSTLVAQTAAKCQGPAELERVIRTHPTPEAYDALGAYFGQRQQLSCAIWAFESAVHLDPNSWEGNFNVALAYLQSQQPEKAVGALRVAISKLAT